MSKRKALGYFDNAEHQPIAYMNTEGLVVFSSESWLKKLHRLGGIRELNNIIKNVDYIHLFEKANVQNQVHQNVVKLQHVNMDRQQRGGEGLFGESVGRCGWGNNPSCCFYDCAPLWRTQVWPWKFYM